jgi:hypothetical protein
MLLLSSGAFERGMIEAAGRGRHRDFEAVASMRSWRGMIDMKQAAEHRTTNLGAKSEHGMIRIWQPDIEFRRSRSGQSSGIVSPAVNC